MWLSEEDYNFIYSKVPRLCVDLVITDSEGLLLSLRDIEPCKDLWHLPGGRVMYKETLEDACKRIAKQELSIDITVEKLLGIMEFPDEVQDGNPRYTVSVVFLCTPLSLDIVGGWQAKSISFFKKSPAAISKEHAEFLQKMYIWNGL